MSGYTVLDFETTGLFPQQHDRVVEVAAVYVSPAGEVQGEWSTLINPRRDVGATHIHGITARDVLQAPTFAEIAPHLIRAVAGRTIVAHNARFDIRFLDHELEVAGVPIRPPSPGLCTMEWSNAFLRGASRKLSDCCAAAGIPHSNAHSALEDARAVAGLLAYYLARCGIPVPWEHVIGHCSTHPWPTHRGHLADVRMVGRSSTKPRPDAWLDRVSSHMPRNDDPVVEAYLNVLEQAMLDRYLSAHEEEGLLEVATTLGLHRDQLTAIHATYLDSLATAALCDGIVTADERAELDGVAAMLGLPRSLVPIALNRAAGGNGSKPASLTLERGDRVVFTGELTVPRDQWNQRAEAAGLVHGGVTKTTKVVIAADPDSQRVARPPKPVPTTSPW